LGRQVLTIMQEEAHLQEIAKLVGQDTLPDSERFILIIARTIKEAFLQQNAMDPIDAYTTPAKQVALLRLILHLYDHGKQIIALGCPVGRLQTDLNVWPELVRLRATVPNNDLSQLQVLQERMDTQLEQLGKEYRS